MKKYLGLLHLEHLLHLQKNETYESASEFISNAIVAITMLISYVLFLKQIVY